MKKIYTNMTQLIGHTPLMALQNYSEKRNLKAEIVAKLEYFNPAGSVKDRVAYFMITDALERGILKRGGTIIEPTSGNTGIGLASIAPSFDLKVILTMPETMSIERRALLAAYGAKLVLTDGKLGMNGASIEAQRLQKELPGSVILGQFYNEANPKAHMQTTGPEIWEDTDGEVDIFVAGVGTGGTLTGVGTYLKQKNPHVKVVAVEPQNSQVLGGGQAGPHKIQGIGAGFVPQVLNTKIYDEIIAVADEHAYETARQIAADEGILVGVSSGAAVYAATQLANLSENIGKRIVVLLPDSGERYLSAGVFDRP